MANIPISENDHSSLFIPETFVSGSSTSKAPASNSDSTSTPSCKSCKQPLAPLRDRQRSTGRFWVNCQPCRNRSTRQKGASRARRTKQNVTKQHSNVPNSGPSTVRPPSVVLQHERQRNLEANLGGLSQTQGHSSSSKAIISEPECSVCGSTDSPDQFPDLLACSHKPEICQECFTGWLTSQINSTSWDRIECPSEGCSVIISHNEMQQYVPAENFARFDELSTRSTLNSDPNFRHCLRPGCNSGQIHDSGVEGNIFRCTACGFLVCTVHDEAFHSGETCEEYDRRRTGERKADNDASAKMIDGTTKICPGPSCGVHIEKNKGCDHMTCRRCRHEFCWRCLAPYRDRGRGIMEAGNYMHARYCKHWRQEKEPAHVPTIRAPIEQFNVFPPPSVPENNFGNFRHNQMPPSSRLEPIYYVSDSEGEA